MSENLHICYVNNLPIKYVKNEEHNCYVNIYISLLCNLLQIIHVKLNDLLRSIVHNLTRSFDRIS